MWGPLFKSTGSTAYLLQIVIIISLLIIVFFCLILVYFIILQFQKHNYAKMTWDRCGKKGFGLRLEEDITRGQFLIEYVGEVTFNFMYAAG